MIRTAILVDGAFYRKRANYFFGDITEVSAAQRATELEDYCKRHIKEEHNDTATLYRVFYYDCPPSEKNIFNPITKKSDNLKKTLEYNWTNDFFKELTHKRKFALRLGRLSDEQAYYNIKPEVTKELLTGKKHITDLTQKDLYLSITQKGVDMRIGIDISSLAYKKQVDRIILISGDSDFVPAAKQARREGIDFILDPMRYPIKQDLFEHIDGMRTKCPIAPAEG